MKDNLFQQYELDALLGDSVDDFDVEGIIEDATTIDADGDRIWTAFGDELLGIIESHDRTMRTKAEFRATRELLGITQQGLADELGVKVLSVKRWESPKYPQHAPDGVWEFLDDLMTAQDDAVCIAIAQVRRIGEEQGRMPHEVVLPYWSSQQDYREHHFDPDDGATWTEVNAANRRIAIVLKDRGIKVRWVDGADNPVPRMQ